MSNDRENVNKAKKDIKQFDNIYKNYFERIKSYFRPKVSNNEFEAEDLTSQTFEKAIKNIKRFKWQGVSFSAWLYTIANNTLIDFYRKNKSATAGIPEDFYHNVKDESELIEESLTAKDTKERIALILKTLPDREQKAIKLKFYDRLSNKEISEKLKISESNVGTIIYRATKKLKDPLEDSQLS